MTGEIYMVLKLARCVFFLVMSVSFKHKICSILIESSQTNLLKLCKNVSPGRKVRQEYPGYAVLFYPVAFLYPIGYS